LWGVGGTFISGAHQAWLADEIGESAATPVYLRATQTSQLASLVGIAIAVVLAWTRLALPFWVAGAAFWALAGVLKLKMSETGYQPVSASHNHPWQAMRETLQAGLAVVRESPALRSALVISVIIGA